MTSALHPLALAEYEQFLASGRPNAHLLPVAVARTRFADAMAQLPRPDVARAQTLSVPGRDGPIAVRRYEPISPARAHMIYFHGGGWVLGDIDTHDGVARTLTNAFQALVDSVNYRLAPDNPFPAAVHDALDATRALAASPPPGQLPLILAGDSAGGNLAAVVALETRADPNVVIAHQLLYYPVTTTDLDAGVDPEYDGIVLYRDELAWHQRNYLPGGSVVSPQVSPAIATLTGAPPATIVLAQCDPIRPQGELYARALTAAGVSVALHTAPSLPHGFLGREAEFTQAAQALAWAVEAVYAQLDSPCDS